jgi:hypothetical protein
MKKTLTTFLAGTLLCSGAAIAASNDPLNIVGTYKCTGYDSHDGHFTGNLTLSLDEKASKFDQNFGAYQFKLDIVLGGTPASYSGYAAAQGESLAIYFANDKQKEAPTDRGVAIGSISHEQDKDGKYITTLRKSYYLPDYLRDAKDGKGPGGRGTETCVKL